MAPRGTLRKTLLPTLVIACLTAFALTASHDLMWRTGVVLEKATGKLPDLTWGDLLWMLRPGSGVYLERLIATPNPFEVIENPRRSPADVEAGKRLFARQCSSCHGDEARGGPGGPSLYGRTFRQGRRPWALYRTITLGVPGTAMAGHALPHNDAWQLVAYIDSLILQPSVSEDAKPLAVRAVTPEELRTAREHPDEWLMYSGSYDAHRHTSLDQIARANLGRLRVEWERQLPDDQASLETSPIIVGSTMFVTEADHVLALDAATGKVLWTFARALPRQLKLCCGTNNRGVAVLGRRVFVGTLDAHLLALDANTGRLLWDITVADGATGYSITSAPLAIGDMVVTGVAGGEYDTRGFIDAYDAATGARRWRFDTVPAAGSPKSETWGPVATAKGGAPTWVSGAFDPELNLIYWGVGNPHPNYFGAGRAGDNLYSNCAVALDAATGKLRWYFQFTPHDLHDWDSAQTPVLVDAVIAGAQRKVLAWANRNGFYYVLDRTSGAYLSGTPFIRQSWADGLDEKGRPRVRQDSIPTRNGVLVYPSVTGATNWWATAYDPSLGLLFVPTIDRGSFFFASPDREVDAQGETLGSATSMVPGERLITAVEALEAATGKLRWRFVNPSRTGHGQIGGLLSTGSGIVFGGDLERFFALDAASGAELWHFSVGAQILAAPVSYAIDGRQYVAIAAGRSILAFALAPDGH